MARVVAFNVIFFLLPFGFALLCIVIARKLMRPDTPATEMKLDDSTLADLR